MKQYQKGEFCKAKDCSGIVKNNNDFCKSYCPYTAYGFLDWLIKHGYRIIHKDYDGDLRTELQIILARAQNCKMDIERCNISTDGIIQDLESIINVVKRNSNLPCTLTINPNATFEERDEE